MEMFNLLKMFNVSERISSIHRFSRDYPSVPENLMEHTGWVAMVSFMIAKDLDDRDPDVSINWQELYSKTLLHDIEEALTGDISGPTKNRNPMIREAISEVENEAIDVLLGYLNRTDLKDDWRFAKDPDAMESLIVKLCDFYAVIYKCWVETHCRGNMGFKRVASELVKYASLDDPDNPWVQYINSTTQPGSVSQITLLMTFSHAKSILFNIIQDPSQNRLNAPPIPWWI